MKRMLWTVAFVAQTMWAPAIFAAGTGGAPGAMAAKPDCADKQKALDDATAAAKASKADLSSCAEKKGKEKADCERPLKQKATADMKEMKEKEKSAKKDLGCCKNPKAKGCST